MFEKLKALLKTLGLDITGKEDQLKAEIVKLEKDKDGNIDISNIDLSKFTNKNSDPAVAALIEQNKILLQSVKDLQSTVAKEQQDRASAMEAAQKAAKIAQEAKVDAAIKKAFEEKKITEAQKEVYKNLLTTDFDNTSKIIEALPVQKQFEDKTNTHASATTPAVATANANPYKVDSKALTDAIRASMDDKAKV